MKHDCTKTLFYLDLKHVHKYGCAKFQPNPLCSSQQMGTEHAGGRKKSRQTHRGSRRDWMPQLVPEFSAESLCLCHVRQGPSWQLVAVGVTWPLWIMWHELEDDSWDVQAGVPVQSRPPMDLHIHVYLKLKLIMVIYNSIKVIGAKIFNQLSESIKKHQQKKKDILWKFIYYLDINITSNVILNNFTTNKYQLTWHTGR